jgi:hypothetical protein
MGDWLKEYSDWVANKYRHCQRPPEPNTKVLLTPDQYGVTDLEKNKDLYGTFQFEVELHEELAHTPERFRKDIENKIYGDAKTHNSLMVSAYRFFHREYSHLQNLTPEELRLLDMSDGEINEEAKQKADQHHMRHHAFQHLPKKLLSHKEQIELAKKDEPRFWRRTLRRNANRITVHVSNLLGLVGGKSRNKITVKPVIHRFEQMQARAEKFKQETMLVGADGTELCLKDVSPTYEQRMAENLCVMAGLQQKAKEDGFTWSFITLTLPPRFHPNPTYGANSWDLTPVYESVEYLNTGWKRIRAMLTKSKVNYYGIRVAEGHEDGCFHTHILMFHHLDDFSEVERAVKFQFNESAIQAKVDLNNGKASAVSYAFKYIQKSTQTHDPKGSASKISNDRKESGKVIANQALRSACGVRSLTWFGIPRGTLTKWRMLGRSGNLPNEFDEAKKLVTERNFLGFIKISNGINILREEITDRFGQISKKIIGLAKEKAEYLKKKFRLVRKAMVTVIRNYPRKSQNHINSSNIRALSDIIQNQNPPPVN